MIQTITVTNTDGTTQVFVPQSSVVKPINVTVPLGVDVILTAESSTPPATAPTATAS